MARAHPTRTRRTAEPTRGRPRRASLRVSPLREGSDLPLPCRSCARLRLLQAEKEEEEEVVVVEEAEAPASIARLRSPLRCGSS